jgi:hypothetical protein
MLVFTPPTGTATKASYNTGDSPGYFSEERLKSLAIDSRVCFTAMLPLYEFSAATPEVPPVSALAAISATMGLASCIALGIYSVLGTDQQIRTAGSLSGLFVPEGLLLGTFGALTNGQRGMQLGADVGAILSDARSFAEYIDSLNPKSLNEILTDPNVYVRGYLGEGYLLYQDFAQYQQDILPPSDSSNTSAGLSDAAAQLFNVQSEPEESPPPPPSAAQCTDGGAYLGPPSDEDEDDE